MLKSVSIGGLASTGRRLGWGVADQGLVSLINFEIGVAVARSVAPREFGVFALLFAAYLVASGLNRAFSCEPLAIRFSGSDVERWQEQASAAVGTALAFGVVAGLTFAIAALFLPPGAASAWWALALGLPGLLVQDCCRYAFFSSRRGGSAFAGDVIWAAGVTVAIVSLAWFGRGGLVAYVASWSGAGTVAAVFSSWWGGLRPRPWRAPSWFREHADLVWRYAFEFLAGGGAMQLAFYGVGATAGLAAVGALRAAQLVLGPLQVVLAGMGVVSLPEAARLTRDSRSSLRIAMSGLSGFFVAASAVWLAAILCVPDEWGRGLLKSGWTSGRAVVVPMGLALAGIGAAHGAITGLRALAAARSSLKARLLATPLIICGGVGGALVGQEQGAAIGLAIASWVAVIPWWAAFETELGSRTRTAPDRDMHPEPSLLRGNVAV